MGYHRGDRSIPGRAYPLIISLADSLEHTKLCCWGVREGRGGRRGVGAREKLV